MRNSDALVEKMYSGKAKPAPSPTVIEQTKRKKVVAIINGGETLHYEYGKRTTDKHWTLLKTIKI
jgi:hypothetical protein